MLRPLCFMIMPFGVKTVDRPPDGAPAMVDFDALWDRAFNPAIEQLGYEAVRADQDSGASIITEMLERIVLSDLVVADMTLPNGNVYYELGVRHASRPAGCVLTSADWARPLFDTAQMRRLTYPLPEGGVTATTAEGVAAALRSGVKSLAQGMSPVHAHLPGFPDLKRVSSQRAVTVRSRLGQIAEFQARVREVRLQSDRARRRELAQRILQEYPPGAPVSEFIAIELAALLRDVVGWTEASDYIDSLPDEIRGLEAMQEQHALALSKSGDHLRAIAALETLVAQRGDSAERQGLIGGRYRRLADAARAQRQERLSREYLDRAIEHYDRGMRLDLNDFYPASNLPFLYRERGALGDEERGIAAAHVARLACERDSENEWSKATLLTLAFWAQDVALATAYAVAVRREGAAEWKLSTTMDTLIRSVDITSDWDKRAALGAIIAELGAQMS